MKGTAVIKTDFLPDVEPDVDSILAAMRWRQALRARQDRMRARTRAAERARVAIGLVRS